MSQTEAGPSSEAHFIIFWWTRPEAMAYRRRCGSGAPGWEALARSLDTPLNARAHANVAQKGSSLRLRF